MKACVLINKNIIEYKEVPTPILKSEEVLLNVKACGICSSDFNRVYKDSAYFFPIILGHEFSGKIVECAPDIDSNVYIGKKAVVFPLLPCKECEYCKDKHYAQCKKYSYFGSRQNGAMAEYIAVPIWNIKLIPDDMSYSVAALAEPAAVACHSANKIDNPKGKSVCISGTGTIGILLGLNLKSKGANITFIVRNDKKKEILKTLGFSNFIQNECEQNFDVTIECVGTNDSLNNCIKYVKSRGLVILVGNPASEMNLEKTLYWKLLRSEITLKGVWNSEYKSDIKDDWDSAIDFLYKNQSVANLIITDRFKFEDGIKAFETVMNTDKISLKGMFENE
ncbi:galactitol-1-phosphate 5-dehydrogenase [bacterium]|nr:galactitol-1-phosphate 5-dehydrogenase [bacterium]